MMRIQKNGSLYQLAFLPSVFPVNCYLFEEEHGLTLIDAALPSSWRQILKAAEKIGKPIETIVLTHAHGDHVGSLDRLKEELPEAEVVISQRDARLLAGNTSLDPDEPQTPIRGGIPKNIRTLPDRLVNADDRIGSLRVIASPGHTPGHMALFDESSGVLIAGDALQTRGGIAVSGRLKPWFPFPGWATWNKEKACESARKLKNLSPSLLAVGHGLMLNDPTAAMERAIEEAERALEGDKHEARAK